MAIGGRWQVGPKQFQQALPIEEPQKHIARFWRRIDRIAPPPASVETLWKLTRTPHFPHRDTPTPLGLAVSRATNPSPPTPFLVRGWLVNFKTNEGFNGFLFYGRLPFFALRTVRRCPRLGVWALLPSRATCLSVLSVRLCVCVCVHTCLSVNRLRLAVCLARFVCPVCISVLVPCLDLVCLWLSIYLQTLRLHLRRTNERTDVRCNERVEKTRSSSRLVFLGCPFFLFFSLFLSFWIRTGRRVNK